MLPIFEAFIFDLDGTLVDSAAIVDQVMRRWCDRNDINFSDLQNSNHGSRSEDTVAAVASHLDAKKEAERIEAMERDGLHDLQEIRGASDFLHQLPCAQWAIATSSSLSTAKAKLNAVKMPISSILISADCVKNGKPHPEAYVTASKKLGVDPLQCLAFEDSETGAYSALNAGCHVLLVGSRCKISDPKIIGRIGDFSELDILPFEDSSLRLKFKPKVEQGSGGSG